MKNWQLGWILQQEQEFPRWKHSVMDRWKKALVARESIVRMGNGKLDEDGA